MYSKFIRKNIAYISLIVITKMQKLIPTLYVIYLPYIFIYTYLSYIIREKIIIIMNNIYFVTLFIKKNIVFNVAYTISTHYNV